jgi:hypothetical protein
VLHKYLHINQIFSIKNTEAKPNFCFFVFMDQDMYLELQASTSGMEKRGDQDHLEKELNALSSNNLAYKHICMV